MQKGKRMKYFLGLDNGGTTTKAALYDAHGSEIAVASTSTESLHPRISFVERDMDEMWLANCQMISSVIAKAGVDSVDILGIAVCGHGKGLYLWARDGRPAMNGIISTDNRAWEYPLKWSKEGIAEEARRISCQDIMSSQPVSLLSWLRDNNPEILEKTQFIFEAKDYIRFRLTGKAAAERSDYSGTGLMNLRTGEYDPELLSLFNLSSCHDKLPPLVSSSDICGYVTEEAAKLTGLKEGTPVAGGAFDIDASAIGSGVIDYDKVCMIAGTWSINEYVQKEPVLDGSVKMNSLFCIPGLYLVEESSPTSAGNLDWFVRNVLRSGSKNIFKELDALAETVSPDTFTPVFLPFVMASNVNPQAMGSFVGINSYHSLAHMARSIFEGVAFSHRYHYEKLLKARKDKPECIRLTGGVANSRIWTEIFADVMDTPVESVCVKEAGALGCAIIAAVATGYYPDFQTAAEKMSPKSERIFPNRNNVPLYDRKYDLYLKAIGSLDSFWDEIRKSGLRKGEE